MKIQGKRDQAEASYLRAVARAPSLAHGLRELTAVGWSQAHLSELRTLLDPDRSKPPDGDIDRSGESLT